MNGIDMKNIIEKYKNLSSNDYVTTLQSQSQIDMFNIIKNKHIDTSTLQSVDIFFSDTNSIMKSKIPSKNWMISTIYDDTGLFNVNCTPTTPCFLLKC